MLKQLIHHIKQFYDSLYIGLQNNNVQDTAFIEEKSRNDIL